MKARIYIVATALLLLRAPAFAADDQDLNSGFGNDLFSGKSAPAFEDPDFFDIDSLTNISPAAGDEGNVPVENVIDSNGLVEEAPALPTVPAHKPDTVIPEGTGGLSSTFSTR
ncbi:MAG TPA: hypothetical protein VIG74_04750 [Alphaproteobacteria bacterium]|jgi:hypothetical protein